MILSQENRFDLAEARHATCYCGCLSCKLLLEGRYISAANTLQILILCMLRSLCSTRECGDHDANSPQPKQNMNTSGLTSQRAPMERANSLKLRALRAFE